MSKIPLIIVAGATASGKTALSIQLAKSLDAEIISADSMQIYKEMNIGTAKPDLAERDGVAHHLLDFLPPGQSFSVAEFTALAHRAAADILARKKQIIVTGGTGLYIDSFANDVDFSEEEQSQPIRRELEERAENEGINVLLRELAEFDPLSAEKLHPNNKKRIIRAVEFYKIHGVPISAHQAQTKTKPSRYRALYMMIDYPREILYDRINRRVDIMLEHGLLSEAETLYKKRASLSKTAAQAIGYKELFDYFDGSITLCAAVDTIKQRSRNYAKRQLTWFRRNPNMHCLAPEHAFCEAVTLCREFLSEK